MCGDGRRIEEMEEEGREVDGGVGEGKRGWWRGDGWCA